jgi:Tfp pilus assembly pilus retraction ATPase PilT
MTDLYRRQTYHLRPDQVERIRVEAFHTRRKISEVLRDIIDHYYRDKREY